MNITIDKDGWIKEAIGIYYPNRSWGAFTQKPREVVLHGTATPQGTAQDIATGWRNVDGDASAHIIINKDGSFVQGLSLNSTAWANCCLTDNPNTGGMWDRRLPVGNQNQWSIAIEHCKDDPNENSDALTPAQQATSFALVKAICEYHGIPKAVAGYDDISNGGVIGHCTIDTLNRTYCPGTYPWAALRDSLKGATHMLPQGWKDDGTKLTYIPNGHDFVKGFRDAVTRALEAGEDPNSLIPLENEVQVPEVELHANTGPGARQLCHSCLWIWTQAKGVMRSAVGPEIARCYNIIDALEQQNKTLQAQIAALKATPTPPTSGAITSSITPLQALIANATLLEQEVTQAMDVQKVTAQHVLDLLQGK